MKIDTNKFNISMIKNFSEEDTSTFYAKKLNRNKFLNSSEKGKEIDTPIVIYLPPTQAENVVT